MTVGAKKLTTREKILNAASEEFDLQGFDGATVSDIRARAGVSNGSFFHAFSTKEELAASLYLANLETYHQAMTQSLDEVTSAAEGVKALIEAHMGWVLSHKASARFLFEQAKSDWMKSSKPDQQQSNERFRDALAKWYEPLMTSGELMRLSPHALIAQIIGPAQLICRGWLSGRDDTDPKNHLDDLITCAVRAIVRIDPA